MTPDPVTGYTLALILIPVMAVVVTALWRGTRKDTQ